MPETMLREPTAKRPELRIIKLSEVQFDEALYPRKEHDPALVQRYAECLESIEAAGKYISVSHDFKLLDGKHRWLGYKTAYQNEPDHEIQVFVYPTMAAHEQFAVAVELNSDHGYQLSAEDKKQCAIALYSFGYTYETIAKKLSVGKTKVTDWLSRTVKEQRDRQNGKIFSLWMACHTQQEIAEATGLSQEAVTKALNGQREEAGLVSKFRENHDTKSNFKDDFAPPIYNIWKQQDKTNAVGHYGNTEARWVENLLYLYTDPLDIVVDPFAGGGSTIDVCKRRGRRYFVSDRKPIISRANEIREWDVTQGLPPLPRWEDVRLVYLDPPYWKQAEGEYSKDPTDLANMELEQFNTTLSGLIKGFAKKMKAGYVALVIQPTQWRAPERQFTDHIADMLRTVNLPIEMRYSWPYESQQCTAQMVEWAKANKKPLVLTRECIVWRVY